MSISDHEYKLYVFVNSILSTAQKGVQGIHANQEFNNAMFKEPIEEYGLWAERDKTVILLEGGFVGDLMRVHEDILHFNRELMQEEFVGPMFYEDEHTLNNTATGFAVLVSSEIYDYPEPEPGYYTYDTPIALRYKHYLRAFKLVK